MSDGALLRTHVLRPTWHFVYESLAELALRYSRRAGRPRRRTSRGGADSPSGMRCGAEAADGLRELEIGGRRHWSGDADFPVAAKIDSAHLLPNYDELFIGYRDRSAFLQLVLDKRPDERTASMSATVIEIDGQFVGGWTRTVSAKAVTVETNYLAAVSAAKRRAVDTQAKRHAAFAGLPVNVISSS